MAPKRKSRGLRSRLALSQESDYFIPPPVREAWIRGLIRDLPGKLDSTQKSMLAEYDAIPPELLAFFYACRRIGKTWLVAVLMLEHCIRLAAEAYVHYVAATADGIKEALIPTMEELTADCPAAILPRWVGSDNMFRFPGGGLIRVSGVDKGNYKHVRGSRSTLTIIDEASWITKLSHVVRSVLGPMTLRSNGSRLIMLSSAPDEPNHEVLEFLADARARGTCVERTIKQRTWANDEERHRVEREYRKAIEDTGGEDSTHFRREFLNELVFDTSSAVVPEWSPAMASEVVRETVRPDHCFRWVTLDPGFTHHSGTLFGHVDFDRARLVVEDEIDVVRTMTTDLVPLIKAKETELWGQHPVHYRYMDNAPDVQAQLQKDGIVFHGVGHKDVRAFANRLRTRLKTGQVVIHPRCKKLVACLYKGTWAKQTTENGVLRYKEDPQLGHFDLLAALTIAANRVRLDEDPRPYVGPTPGPRTWGGLAPSNQAVSLDNAFKHWGKKP